jgi:hypothetical protein
VEENDVFSTPDGRGRRLMGAGGDAPWGREFGIKENRARQAKHLEYIRERVHALDYLYLRSVEQRSWSLGSGGVRYDL